MQQHSPQQQHQASPTPISFNLTTDQIQRYLDENKQLIMAILENQNLGKFAECASFQAQLQQNLMYLARIADCQPQGTAGPVQPSLQKEQYIQPPQVAMTHQIVYLPAKLPFHLNDQEQQYQ